MSILVVQLVPDGLIFGADRNITSRWALNDGGVLITASGQSERPKVLKWPNREVIIGYVGEARIAHQATDEWLYWFIGQHLEFDALATVAEALRSELDELMQLNLIGGDLTIHLGGFEVDRDEATPRIFFIHNTNGIDERGIYVLGSAFVCSDEIKAEAYFGDALGENIRASDPVRRGFFSFRQGTGLVAFNRIDEALRDALVGLQIIHDHAPSGVTPRSLDDWAKHVKFTILGYGAYFKAFYPAHEQFVGGGADAVHATWPESPPEGRERFA